METTSRMEWYVLDVGLGLVLFHFPLLYLVSERIDFVCLFELISKRAWLANEKKIPNKYAKEKWTSQPELSNSFPIGGGRQWSEIDNRITLGQRLLLISLTIHWKVL